MFVFNNDADGVEMMAIFVANLFKQGITFHVRHDSFSFEITLKGF
jgi:hypothetical protein